MNIIFLEIHGVVATRDTDHRLSLEKLQKLNYLVSQTGARIVIASRYAFAEESVEELKDSISKSWRRCWGPKGVYENEAHIFARSICDMLPRYKECNAQTGYAGGKGEAIKTWLANHRADNIEHYAIIDPYNHPYLDEQVFHLVQTDTSFGLSDWTVHRCASILKGGFVVGSSLPSNLRLYELEKAKGWMALSAERGDRRKKKNRWKKK